MSGDGSSGRDLCRNPLEIGPGDTQKFRALATVLGGRVTYRDPPEYNRVRRL